MEAIDYYSQLEESLPILKIGNEYLIKQARDVANFNSRTKAMSHKLPEYGDFEERIPKTFPKADSPSEALWRDKKSADAHELVENFLIGCGWELEKKERNALKTQDCSHLVIGISNENRDEKFVVFQVYKQLK